MNGVPDIVRIPQRTDGDCLRCCVAMILRVAYEAVPDFVKLAAGRSTGWLAELDEWLAKQARCSLVIEGDNFSVGMPNTLPCIAIGPTHRGTRHVVARGNGIIVDPHADQAGLLAIEAIIVIANKYLVLGASTEDLNAAVKLVTQRTDDDSLRCCAAMIYGVAYEVALDGVKESGESAIDVDALDAWQSMLPFRSMCLVERVQSPVPADVYFYTPLIEYGIGVATGQLHYVVRTAYGLLDPHPSGLGLRAVDGVFQFHRQNGGG